MSAASPFVPLLIHTSARLILALEFSRVLPFLGTLLKLLGLECTLRSSRHLSYLTSEHYIHPPCQTSDRLTVTRIPPPLQNLPWQPSSSPATALVSPPQSQALAPLPCVAGASAELLTHMSLLMSVSSDPSFVQGASQAAVPKYDSENNQKWIYLLSPY